MGSTGKRTTWGGSMRLAVFVVLALVVNFVSFSEAASLRKRSGGDAANAIVGETLPPSKGRVAVLVAGDVDRYLPAPTIQHLLGAGSRAGFAVDYYAALVGSAKPDLAQRVGAKVVGQGGRLQSFSVVPQSLNSSRSLGGDAWRLEAAERLSDLWPEVEAAEKVGGWRYRQVLLVREDAYWLADPKGFWELPADSGYMRSCSNAGTPAVFYALPRAAAPAFVHGYADFARSSTMTMQEVPENFLLSIAETQRFGLNGLEAAFLPVVPAGRRPGGSFEDACAIPCSTDGCLSPPELERCGRADSPSLVAKVPCLDGSSWCFSKNQRLPPQEVLKFYQMAHATTRIMKKHGIWHIATGGTLLGAVRNQGIIPHDDDVDFSIFRNPGESIMDTAGFKADVVANGMYLHKVHQDFWKLKAKENPDRAVDIFGLVVLDSDTGVAEVKYDDNMWPRQSLPIKVMYGGALRMWKFGEIEVQGPQEDVAIAHFNQAYGPDWNKTISCKGTNHVCVGVQDAEWDLHGRAMPTGPIEEPRWC